MRRAAVAIAVLLAAGCARQEQPVVAAGPLPAALCASGGAALHADLEGAPALRCSVDGPRKFSLLVTPEHAPPINPSPWYAFRYEAGPGDPIEVTLRYLGAKKHRYPPKLIRADGSAQPIPATVAGDSASASFQLGAGSGTVAAQELVLEADNQALLGRLAALPNANRLLLGRSHDGRPIEAVRLGDERAPRLIVLMGRQHPPEVSGALAMSAFVETLFARLAADPALLADTQLIAIPMLNPDGVARGHWRFNLGGLDLNRDWGDFTQPETRAVKAWLDGLPPGVRPVLMIDFHSTDRNLFYVQGEEEAQCDHRFAHRWLGALEGRIADYPFKIEPRNANPGLGTAKNWFCRTYSIPSLTYEVDDEADRPALRRVAADLAGRLIPAIAKR